MRMPPRSNSRAAAAAGSTRSPKRATAPRMTALLQMSIESAIDVTDRSPKSGGTASPLRRAKAEDLVRHLRSSGGDDLSGTYEEMGERGLSRADVDRAIDDL